MMAMGILEKKIMSTSAVMKHVTAFGQKHPETLRKKQLKSLKLQLPGEVIFDTLQTKKMGHLVR
jgi:hypothetical protein